MKPLYGLVCRIKGHKFGHGKDKLLPTEGGVSEVRVKECRRGAFVVRVKRRKAKA